MIDWQGLSARYPGGQTLIYDDTAVPEGGILVLRGDSGAGKSTLLGLLAGLLQPASGQIRVGGIPLSSLKAAALDAWRGRHLGLLPQKAWLSPALTVSEQVALPFVCTGDPVDTQAIGQVLDALGIQHLASRRPHELSVGQTQRVALARAVVRQPTLVLADEPTASLDDRHAASVVALLRQTASRATLVIATHDARVVAQLAGTPHQVLNLRPPA